MPDTSTEVALATTTLSSNASNITFSSIPGTYTDLRLVLSSQATIGQIIQIRFNGDSASNYSDTIFFGNGGNAGTYRETGQTYINFAATEQTSGSIFVFRTLDIFSYAGSANKTCLSTESNDLNGSGEVYRGVYLWRNTAAITSITIYPFAQPSFNLKTGTTATLYGIL